MDRLWWVIRMSSADTESLRWLQSARQRLADALHQLENLGVEKGNGQLQQNAEALLKKLQGFHFNLVLLGEFKRGKSTLVNALIGAPVLPTATIPLTSVTTIVRYGKEARLFVSLANGNTLELGIEEIEQYVTERRNPGNKLQVNAVEVEYPAELLQDGVRIVDTPGTGSVYLHNTETTFKFLPEADAAIFLFVADQPASRNELDFLHEARKFAKRLFLVQNKTDYLDEPGRAESLLFLQMTLENELGEPCVVYPLSGRQALEAKQSGDGAKLESSGFSALQHDLIQFLTTERAVTFIKSVASRIHGLALQSEQLTQLEQQVAAAPLTKLEESLLKFQHAAAEIITQQSDADHIVRGEVSRLIKSLEDDLKPVVADNVVALVQSVVQTFEQHKRESNDQLIETLRSSLKEHIEQIFNNWRRTEDEKVRASFDKITGRFVDRGNQLIREIKTLTRELFELEVTAHFDVEPLTDKSRHYYAVDNPFTLLIQTMPLLLPDPIAKSIIRSRFQEFAESELSRNAGRLRADYQERIEDSGRRFLSSFHAQIAASLLQIETILKGAIERRRQGVLDHVRAAEQLEAQLSTIRHVLALALDEQEGAAIFPV